MSEDSSPPAVPPNPPPKPRPRRLAREFRWQAFFQQSDEPIFVLDRRQRLLFVNRAWENLTGMSAAQAHVLRCRHHRPSSPGDSLEAILAHALTPPPQALQGTTTRVRRLLPACSPADNASPAVSRPPSWWEVEFFPLRQGGKTGGFLLLGRILPLPGSGPTGPVRLPEGLLNLRQRLVDRFRFDRVASNVPAMRRALDQARLAAQLATPVLLVGEAGTGKETLARIIHHTGRSRERPFAALDCSRLPAAVLSSLLFGPATAVGTQALGTLYLKEPGQLPRDVQLRLCELIAVRAANPDREGLRILAGCRLPVAEEVRAGRLLEELACAVSTLVIEVPPLHQRLPDLPALVEPLLERVWDLTTTASDGPTPVAAPRRVVGLTAAAWTVMNAYSWPGNLRELYAVLLGAAEHARGERIDAGDLPASLRLLHQLEPIPGRPPERMPPLKVILEKVERRLIERALLRARGNRSEAADLLDVWRPLLWRRIKALKIPDPEGEQRMKRKQRKPGDGDNE